MMITAYSTCIAVKQTSERLLINAIIEDGRIDEVVERNQAKEKNDLKGG